MNNLYKNIGLFIGVALLLVLIYNLAIKKTITIKKRYNELVVEEKSMTNANAKIKYLYKKNQYLDSLLTKKNISLEHSFQQMLLNKITSFTSKEKFEVVRFNQPHVFEEKQLIFETYSFELRGAFFSILKLINYIENERLGEVISVGFNKKTNYRTRKKYVVATVYLRRIKKQEKVF